MRLHHLQITAFGPFSGAVEVDFDDLSHAGLFLMSGATGSGKTSVLDAVTFALFGAVPGERNAAKRLRSDHAASHVRPEVTLETTLAGRRFRVTRTPAWERPKKRGTGMTSEQASVSLCEQVEGHWRHLSSRADESGQLIGDLLGMNLTQFTQVALLPQGQFQAFLRATSEERHHLLQRLFRTGRFEQVESWLREHRVTLRRETTAAHHQVAEVVSRLSEALDAPLPDDWDLADLSDPATDGTLEAWLHEHHRDIGARLVEARSGLDTASDAEETTRVEVRDAEAFCQRRARLDQAAQEKSRLEDQAVDQLYRRDTVSLARRAAGVADLIELADNARERWLEARRETGRCLEAGPPVSSVSADVVITPQTEPQLCLEWDEPALAPDEDLDLDRLLDSDPSHLGRIIQAGVRRVDQRAAELRALLPRHARRTAVMDELSRLDRRRQATEREQATLTTSLAAAMADLERKQGRLSESVEIATRVDPLSVELAEVAARLSAFGEATTLLQSLEAAEQTHLEAVGQAQDLRERWLHLKEVRLESMAAEIALQLAVGACCPVCGSADHPDKARRDSRAPDAAQEKNAFKAMENAKAEAHARDVAVRDLGTRLALARQRAGSDSEESTKARHTHLSAERTDAQTAARQVLALRTTVAELEQTCRDLTVADAALATNLTQVETTSTTLRAEVRRLDVELSEAMGDGTADDLMASIEQAEERSVIGRRALDALIESSSAAEALEHAETRLGRALERARFDSIDQARAALANEAEIEVLEEAVRGHDARLAAVQQVLAEPGAREHLCARVPDLEVLIQHHERARSQAQAQRDQVSVLAARAERLRDLGEDLAVQHRAWRPLHEQWTLASALSAFVEGKSPDNRWHMRLSAYVLAYRLTQVVDSANERLVAMTDQRYTLVHTGQRGAGEKRGGLSLLIRDEWTGEMRDPVTLSGGETFVVSLALALGLADVISDEAGGARLDTLFVDEGFGSLDAETLDGVMDILDSLRDGGRVVGVVSHVAEMRDRIPTQLVVHKSREGSSLSVRS